MSSHSTTARAVLVVDRKIAFYTEESDNSMNHMHGREGLIPILAANSVNSFQESAGLVLL